MTTYYSNTLDRTHATCGGGGGVSVVVVLGVHSPPWRTRIAGPSPAAEAARLTEARPGCLGGGQKQRSVRR